MKDYFKDYNFDDWEKLSKEKQIDIINNYWDPFKPTIGLKTKSTIIDNFLKNQKTDSIRQVGIKNFGFYSVELFVITDNSEIKIPKKFAGLPINKGVIIETISENVFKVKWRYHGHDEVNLTEKVIIK